MTSHKVIHKVFKVIRENEVIRKSKVCQGLILYHTGMENDSIKVKNRTRLQRTKNFLYTYFSQLEENLGLQVAKFSTATQKKVSRTLRLTLRTFEEKPFFGNEKKLGFQKFLLRGTPGQHSAAGNISPDLVPNRNENSSAFYTYCYLGGNKKAL